MIDSNTCGPFNDLWSLGVIIFEMLTGDVPFKGKDEIDLFDKIMNPSIRPNYPKSMPADAVDLIDKILNPNPIKRLGYTNKEGNRNYTALKGHQFFQGLDFELIKSGKISPPLPEELSPKKEDFEYNNISPPNKVQKA